MSICLTISKIDWAITKDVFTIIGTISAIVIGAIGLTTWRRQLKGTSEYEVAKKAILLTYEIEQAIQGVRNPMLHLPKDEVESGRRLEAEQQIYADRFVILENKWAELQTIKLESKVIWDNAAAESFNEIRDIIGKLRGGIWLHFWMKGAYAGPGATVDNSAERRIENDKIVYYTSEDDEFTLKIKHAVEHVENFFKDKVRSK
ncbi:hypothetical protein [Alteromonas lipotrueae]|uniref:hypothetical protein n=1 Tax=Alteromonas lipotrueae TaxID=2803814 RepID=UPI00215BA808|nr:hypothetical protein [Alteromonas lipotrueae]